MFMTLFFLAACGESEKDTSHSHDTHTEEDTSAEDTDSVDTASEETEETLSPEPADLVGTWLGPCFPSPAGDGSFNQLQFTFTEDTWTLDYVANGDDACTVPFMTVHIEGPYTLEDASETVEGARNGTFGFTTKTVTPNLEDAVAVVNDACGTTEAALDTAFDLAAGCAGLGAYPIADCPADYDIVKLNEDGTLTFGARPQDNNMCTADKRPTELQPGGLTKQQVFSFQFYKRKENIFPFFFFLQTTVYIAC